MSESRRDESVWPAVLLVLGILAARVVYVAWVCPYNLVEDEAHYWLWSRFPDWSYYSKGPGVAWSIWLATRVLGNAEWAVRMPAVLMSGVGGWAGVMLARDVARKAWASRTSTDAAWARATPRIVAVYAASAMALAPALQAVGFVMTIDGPYLACWALACWAAWRAMEERSRSAWVALGAAVAAGFLFKYTMLLIVPGLLMYAWMRRGRLNIAAGARTWIVVGGAVALAGLLPVVIWNAQNGWATWRHLLGHLGMRGGDVPLSGEKTPWSATWLPELIAQELAMIGPLLVLAGVAAWKTIGEWKRMRSHGLFSGGAGRGWEGKQFLMCAAAPILVFYAIVALIAEPEGNWPLAAQVTLMPLAGWWAADLMAERRAARARGERMRRGSRLLWHAAIVYGVVGAVVIHKADWLARASNAVNGNETFRGAFMRLTNREPRPLSLGRLFGAPEMAAHVKRLLEELRRETGKEGGGPFVITQHYGRASQLAYELRDADGRPRGDIFSAMVQTGGRRSQFDVWPWASLERPDLVGRPAVILSNERPEVMAVWEKMFESVKKIRGGRLDGEGKADRFGFVGTGYRGWRSEQDETRDKAR